jgi:hypothetical protein
MGRPAARLRRELVDVSSKLEVSSLVLDLADDDNLISLAFSQRRLRPRLVRQPNLDSVFRGENPTQWCQLVRPRPELPLVVLRGSFCFDHSG